MASLKIDRVTAHAIDVVNDKSKRWGKLHKLSCQRHLDDLEKSKSDEYKFKYDARKAKELIDFAESLTIIEGFEQITVKLKPFQCFILGCRHGWIYKKNYKINNLK